MNLGDIISIQSGFKAAVSIIDDLNDKRKVVGYIPTTNGAIFLEEVFRSIDTTKSSRPLILTGTYGTGKSHLGLITAAMLTGEDRQDSFDSIVQKIERKWQEKGQTLRNKKKSYGEKPFLLVYLEAEEIDFGAAFVNNSLLLALKRTLSKNGLSSLIPETAYDSAVNRILEWKNKYPETYSNLKSKVSERGYTTIDNLINRLKERHEKKALDDFSLIHHEICSGASFDIFSNVNASDAYKSVVEAIRKQGYGGILLIWDEFTPVMKKLVADPEGNEALNFQKFAQMCEGSGSNKVVFIAISHRTIEETIDIVSQDSLRGDIAKAAEKISGRFKPISLGHIDKEAYHLMSGIIIHKPQFEEIKQNFNERFLDIKETIKKTNIFYNLTDDDLKTLVYSLYPLHPVTTFILSHLSDRIGQRNRSIFTYLCDSGEATFSSFLNNNVITNKTFPLILPRDILEYFLPLMKTTQDDRDIRKMTQAFLNKRSSLDVNDHLADSILKSVLLLNATRAIPATEDNLTFAMGAFTDKEKEKLINKLQELKEKKILKKRISDNGWYFYGLVSEIPIEDHLLEIIRESERTWTLKDIFLNALKIINIKQYLRIIEADDYNTERDLKRRIELDFITSQELNNPDSLSGIIRKNFLDGKYYFILAGNEAEGNFVVQKIRLDFKEITNMLFAIPSDFIILNDLMPHLKRLKAFDLLPEKNPVYMNELREELITEKEDTERFLKEKLENILDPMKSFLFFYARGEKIDISTPNHLKQLVSRMMNETFPYTPAIAREELVDDDRHDTLKKYRIFLIDTVLSPNAPKLLITDRDSTRQHLIEVFYKRHGILKMVMGEWIISKPDKNNEMAKIWDKIEEFIKTPFPMELNKLINELRFPPYGLKKKTIGPIFASVIRQYVLDNQLVFYGRGMPIDHITGELIEDKLINKNQEIRVLFQEITEKHKLILTGIRKAFEIEFDDMDSISRGVTNWWRGLPQYSRNTYKISEMMKKIKGTFFIPLSSEEKDKKELFHSILPDIIGLEDLRNVVETEIEYSVFQKLSEIKRGFENNIVSLRKEIESSVTECLGQFNDLKDYCKRIPAEVKESALSGDGRKVMKWLEQSIENHKFDTAELAVELMGNIENWNDESVIKLKGHIESAKNAIDSYHPMPGSAGDTTGASPEPEPIKEEVLFNLKGKRFHKYFKYHENLEKSPNNIQAMLLYDVIKSSLIKNYKNGQITGDEVISILYKLLLEVFEDA